MSNETKPKRKGAPRIFLIIIVTYLILSFLPAVSIIFQSISQPIISIIRDRDKDNDKDTDPEPSYPYDDLKLLSVDKTNLSMLQEWMDGILANTIPELQDVVVEDGYQLYQFDVHLRNEGNDSSRYDGSVYIWSDDGNVIQVIPDYDPKSEEKDTRILPPGREAVVTIYAMVEDGTPRVYAKTYNTKNLKPASIIVEME